MRMTGLVLLGLGFLTAGGPAADEKDAAADRKQLQGEWRFVAAEGEGEKAPDEFLKACRLVVKDDTLTFVVGDRKTEHRFKLDPTKEPKAIDLEQLTGDDKGKTMAGIYVIEKGEVRMCLPIRAGTKTARPKAFETKDGDFLSMFTLKPAAAK